MTQHEQDPRNPQQSVSHDRAVDAALLAGIAHHAKLVSLKVLDDTGAGSSMNVVRALEYVRTQINGQKLMRVHGVEPERRIRVQRQVVRVRAESSVRRGQPARQIRCCRGHRGWEHRAMGS